MTSPSPIFINPSAKHWRFASPPSSQPQPASHSGNITPGESPITTFHRRLPGYAETPLHSLPSLARELKLGQVLVKDETHRFGLASPGMLGAASWAVYRAVIERLQVSSGRGRRARSAGMDTDMDADTETDMNTEAETEAEETLDLAAFGAKIKEMEPEGLRMVTCTEGDDDSGRAVARTAGYMGFSAGVMAVPAYFDEGTRQRSGSGGAGVRVVDGDYGVAVEEAAAEWEGDEASLVMDGGREGDERVPQWVVEGYHTMLDESDAQVLRLTGGKAAMHAVVPVGGGLVAQAVTQHFKSAAREQRVGSTAAVVAVEPDTAACLKASLERAKMTSVPTEDSIMCGMNCGTLSVTAWPVLRSGVDGSVVVSDAEAHSAVQELEALGVKAGPCGAATLAALKKASTTERAALGLSEESVVVLYCTEGPREYTAPV